MAHEREPFDDASGDRASGEKDSEYIELKDRVVQDVMHDNFVPRYSGLATARPSRVVLVGIWLIFLPMLLWGLIGGSVLWRQSNDVVTKAIAVLASGFFTVICLAILYQQTTRFVRARHDG